MRDNEGLNRIYQSLSFWPKNNCQEQFFFSLLKYAKHKDNPDYIHESVFVSENPIFFEKYLRGSPKVSLKHLFPNLTLLNLDRLKEVLDFYEMRSGNYYFNHVKLDLKEEWYFRILFSDLPALANALNKYSTDEDVIKLLKALAFRFRKLFYCINTIGIEHYFGNLKRDPLDPDAASSALNSLGTANIIDLRGFIDPDNLFILFYHAEYFIALVTGVFDNLALLTIDKFQIKLDKIRVSLSNDSGQEFIERLKAYDPSLVSYINRHRDFISLIYQFRNSVIHGEGLNRIVSPLVPNWSSFVKITPEVNYYLKRLGDDKSEYKIISKWGVFDQNSYLLLDPYYFAKHVLETLKMFTDEYLQKLYSTN